MGLLKCDWKKRLNKSIIALKTVSKRDTLALTAAKLG